MVLADTSRFLSTVSTVSARNAWDHYSLLARTHEKKGMLTFLSLAAKANKTNKTLKLPDWKFILKLMSHQS